MEQVIARQVRCIPANPRLTAAYASSTKRLRVAAYCRVSTDDEEQLTSYATQLNYYTTKINDNPDWDMVKVFADEGISGTSLKNREQFKQMIAACKRGRIDVILTKSVSRFARNTIDCLDTVRMLKSRGIAVIFEKENINTLKETSEFLITLFSGFAQAESESISQNVTWGVRKRMKDGHVNFQYAKLLGYEKGDDGKPRIVPEEAATVKRIYRSYLAGMSLGQIKKELEADAIPTSRGVQTWSYQVIKNILTNEKYIGDALLQKTFRTDCITKITKKNTGELPQYYVEGSHEAIISGELYNRVQAEMARRSNKKKVMQKSGKTQHGKYSGKYALSERLVCGECGSPYKRCTWARNGVKRIVWRCTSRLEYGTKYCNDSPTIDEYRLHNAIARATNRIVENRTEIQSTIMDALSEALGAAGGTTDITELRKKLERCEQHREALLDEAMTDMDAFTQKLLDAKADIDALKSEISAIEQIRMITDNENSRLQEVYELLKSIEPDINEYDDGLTAMIVEKITVINKETIRVKYTCGIELEEIL